MINRRKILQLAGASAVAGAAASTASRLAAQTHAHDHGAPPARPEPQPSAAPDVGPQKLFIPGASGPFDVLDVASPLQLRATAASFPILPGKPSPFLLYQTEQAGKAYQNPILRLQSGARFSAKLVNDLKEPTIIHWHGLHTPGAMDGNPASTIPAGGRYDYDFTVKNRGGTYWYHTHGHGFTASQAYHGLASFFLVEDDDQRRLAQALDLRLGQTDIPLVIQDKQLDAAGKLLYQPNMQESMMGWLGDVILANLTPHAYLSVTPRLYRFRLLNGSNARIYRLAFVKGKTLLDFSVIGTDGGLLDKPYTMKEAFLAPGERLDVLFDAGQAQPGEEIFLKSLAFDPMENEGTAGDMAGHASTSRLALGAEFDVLRLAVTPGQRLAAPLPVRLSGLLAIRTEGAAEREIALSMGQMRFLINGKSFQMDEFPLQVKRGAVEVWRISNPAVGMPHPMHLHGFGFQVLERRGSPAQVSAGARFGRGRTVSDLGWKDTVLIWPGETVKVAIDFSHDFKGDQDYVFHCHNLEHEDANMMINYRVKA